MTTSDCTSECGDVQELLEMQGHHFTRVNRNDSISKPGQLHLSSARQSPPPFSIAMVFAPQGEKKAKDGGWVCGMH